VNRYREQVAAAVAAVQIRGPTRYAWLGRPSRRLPASIAGELDAAARRRYLVGCLRDELYASFYCQGRPVTARWRDSQPTFPDPRLVDAMSCANTGRGSWDPGWRIERIDGAQAVVAQGGLRVRLALADCDPPRPDAAAVRVPLPKELPELAPGFYTVVSDAPQDAPDGVVRVYWNITAAGAPALVGALTARLNAAGIPFRLKVADHPYRFDRCDAGVLYVERERFRELRDLLAGVAAALATHLRRPIPALTLPLAPGVGLAEEDSGGDSFGERRCALLADGIVRAHEHGEDPLATVADRFAEEGMRLDAPYRTPALEGRHVL
jgi:hypothetical protein